MSEAAIQEYCYTSMSASSQRLKLEFDPARVEFNRITSSQSTSPFTELHLLTKIGKYRLKRRLRVTITREGDLFFVENQELNLWGDGTTPEEAIESFERFFLYDLRSYMQTPVEKMDYFATQELMRYKSLLGLP